MLIVLNDILTTVSFICKRCGKQFSDNCTCASYESEPWRAGKAVETFILEAYALHVEKQSQKVKV